MSATVTASAADPAAATADLSKSKRITKAYEVKHAETGTPFSRTSVLSSAIDAPGTHEPLAGEVDPNVFATGRRTERPDPKHFLSKHSGIGGNATSLMTEVRSCVVWCSAAAGWSRWRAAAPSVHCARGVNFFLLSPSGCGCRLLAVQLPGVAMPASLLCPMLRRGHGLVVFG